MPSHRLYSTDDIKKAYEQTADHVHTKNIITQYSTNPHDIKNIALDGLELSWVKHILELGCGYGAFTKKLSGRLNQDAEITGIDMVSENGPHFFATVIAMGYKCSFIHGHADLIKQMPSDSVDLVIASYSLYFFPHLIREISRILNPKGVFIAITHSRYSLQEVLHFIPSSLMKMGLARLAKTRLARLFGAFCMENGQSQLAPYFNKIEVIVYENRLMFNGENLKDCLDYLEKKDSLLFKDIEEKYPEQRKEIQLHFYKELCQYVEEKGVLSITKDDAIFRCFQPVTATLSKIKMKRIRGRQTKGN
jgi:SAM-dependent methyltransferase